MKRKKMMLVTVLFGAALLCGVVFTLLMNRTPEEVVYAPVRPLKWDYRPPSELTSDETERKALEVKLRFAIPNVNISTGLRRHSFGQGAKLCDWVVVGTIGEITDFHAEINLLVETCLHGKLPKGKQVFRVKNYMDPLFADIADGTVKVGDKILVFLVGTGYDGMHLITSPRPAENADFFEFDKAKAKGPEREKTDGMYAWSYLLLDDTATEKAATCTAKGYLDFFGEKGKRDRERYVEFLCSLLNSPVKRIRDDAESDLVLFYEREMLADLDRLLTDGRVRKEVKDYLRYLLRDEKPAR